MVIEGRRNVASERKLKVPTGAILSKYLRALAVEAESMTDGGDIITKAAALAALVWKHALGFEEPVNPDKPDEGKVRNKPATWAIELLYNRIEGKIPVAVVEDQGKSLTEKVSDLGKAKINAAASAAADEREDDEPGDD
jgi:hypothetical protein